MNKIFFDAHALENNEENQQLSITLQRAGFTFNAGDSLEKELENSTSSIHFISKQFSQNEDKSSFIEDQLNKIREHMAIDKNFKAFIWMPQSLDYSDADKEQLDLISRLEQGLSDNMILSRVPSAIQFVEDVILVMEQQPVKIYETKPVDVFIIFNQKDEKEAGRILTLLSGIVNIEKLSVNQDVNMNYEEFSAQQMNVSRLSVIYYKNAPDWAYPFMQQIWKKVGGALAKSPMLFISDDAAVKSGNKPFEAPRVSFFTLPNELIPLEIKIQLDTLNESV